MKEIVVINGTGGSGKDTFVTFASKSAKVFNFSSVAKVKELAKMIGWTGEKTEKARKLLSDLKRITTEYNDFSFQSILQAIAYFKSEKSEEEIMFIHIREPEEIKRVVKQFQAVTLLIKRKDLSNITSNDSDKNVDQYPYDYTIENSSLELLEQSADQFIKELRKRNTL